MNPYCDKNGEIHNQDVLVLGNKEFLVVPRVKNTIIGSAREVHLCPMDFSVCPYCFEKLMEYVMMIPILDNKCVKICLMYCYHCKCYFSSEKDVMYELNNACNGRMSLKLVNHYCENACEEDTINYRGNIKSHYCTVVVSSKNEIRVYSVVSNQIDVNREKRIMHYCDEISRELLTALALGRKSIMLDDMQFAIQQYCVNNANESVNVIDPDQYVEIVLKKNGGYYEPDATLENVVALVFCEKSSRFEMVSVTYDSKYDIYYIDSKVYREFEERFGFMLCVKGTSDKDGHMKLNDESLLHILEYNVNKKDGLSSYERHDLLGRIVDSDQLKVYQIVNCIQSSITRNGNKDLDAIVKWKEDLDFIKNYRVNPERFTIVKELCGKRSNLFWKR